MTYTEENIIYQILTQALGAEQNDDQSLDERDIRALLLKNRAALLEDAYSKWQYSTGEEFQNLGELNLTPEAGLYWVALPKIIPCMNFQGIKAYIGSGYQLSVSDKEMFDINRTSLLNKSIPCAGYYNNKLYVHLGTYNGFSINAGQSLNDLRASVGTSPKIVVEAILFEPKDLASYDWTTSPFPLSNELIVKAKDKILYRDLQITLKASADQVTNMSDDKVRYHDQGKID